MSWASNQPTEYLVCRDTGFRHRWESETVARDGNGFIEDIRCLRCKALKRRFLTATGRIKRPSKMVEYPEGYLRQGLGHVTKSENAQIRLESLHRRLE